MSWDRLQAPSARVRPGQPPGARSTQI